MGGVCLGNTSRAVRVLSRLVRETCARRAIARTCRSKPSSSQEASTLSRAARLGWPIWPTRVRTLESTGTNFALEPGIRMVPVAKIATNWQPPPPLCRGCCGIVRRRREEFHGNGTMPRGSLDEGSHHHQRARDSCRADFRAAAVSTSSALISAAADSGRSAMPAGARVSLLDVLLQVTRACPGPMSALAFRELWLRTR